jgi:hypothetical protein
MLKAMTSGTEVVVDKSLSNVKIFNPTTCSVPLCCASKPGMLTVEETTHA